MNSGVIQLIVLAGIALFLILRLKSVLGTREGYEKPQVTRPKSAERRDRTHRDFEVIEGGPDTDITDHVTEGSESATALAAMKRAEPEFGVRDFLRGARGAYEMILKAFDSGTLEDVRDFIAEDVFEAFAEAVASREQEGYSVESNFVGIREVTLQEATFDPETGDAELTVRFVGELTSVVRDSDGEIVEGDPNEIKRQRDVWTFGRRMGSENPNWQLVATDE